jgi:thioredoxin 1
MFGRKERGGHVSRAVFELTEATFDDQIKSSLLPVLVEFWAEWCPPCRMLAPILQSLGVDYDGPLRIFKINVDERPELARRFEVISTPTVLVFADGEMRQRLIGARSRSRLLEDLSGLLSDS